MAARYYFYLDETGDHGLSFIDKNFPLFLLCGCLFSKESLSAAEANINALKLKYFKTTKLILHSREIRKCEGPFQILFDLSLKARFYKDLNDAIKKADYRIVGCGVNKAEHVKRYGKGAADPYALSLSFVIERLIFCLGTMDRNAVVSIHPEVRGAKEDELLAAQFNSIMDRGTHYVNSERLKSRIIGFKFYQKRDNIVGLQIADLSAYPLARHLLEPEVPYIPFDILKRKIYCDKDGSYKGWGLKVFP